LRYDSARRCAIASSRAVDAEHICARNGWSAALGCIVIKSLSVGIANATARYLLRRRGTATGTEVKQAAGDGINLRPTARCTYGLVSLRFGRNRVSFPFYRWSL